MRNKVSLILRQCLSILKWWLSGQEYSMAKNQGKQAELQGLVTMMIRVHPYI